MKIIYIEINNILRKKIKNIFYNHLDPKKLSNRQKKKLLF